MCDEHNALLFPLHAEKGGPMTCLRCGTAWHAINSRRRKWGRIAVKAMRGFLAEGGEFDDLDRLKLAASPILGYAAHDLGTDAPDITSELLADIMRLVHPDKHPPERRELAMRVTQELNALKPYVFPKPKPQPPEERAPEPNDDNGSSIFEGPKSKEPSRPAYPCRECDGVSEEFYCDACKAEAEKEAQRKAEADEREWNAQTAKQRAWYARRRERELKYRPKKQCASCAKEFNTKRTDARFCSERCRQRAHRKAPVTDKPKHRVRTLFIRDAKALILTALKRHPAVFLNDLLPPDRTQAQYQALCRASRMLEQAGEVSWFSYWCRYGKPGFLVLHRPTAEPPSEPYEIVRLESQERRSLMECSGIEAA
jgi:hypothetical protein